MATLKGAVCSTSKANTDRGLHTCEYKAVRKNYATLIKNLWQELAVMVDQFFSSELISIHQKSELSSGQLTYASASKIMDGIMTKIEGHIKWYYVFLGVLRNSALKQIGEDIEEHRLSLLESSSPQPEYGRGSSSNETFRSTAKKNTVALEDRPTLPSLIAFKMTNGEVLNILNEIGSGYHDFGILLLKDNEGKTMNSLIEMHQRNFASVLREVFKLWFEGKGERPVSWQTIINVLNAMELKDLAQKILQ